MSQEHVSLSPVELLDCEARPFGYDLALTLNFRKPQRLTNEHHAIAEAMKRNLNQLSASPHWDDQKSLEAIDNFYRANDLQALQNEQGSVRINSNIASWLGRTSCHNVARFAVWNTDRHIQLQEALIRDHEHLADDTITRTEQLINLGLFPDIALSRVEQAIGAYGVLHAMDSFEAGARQANGYCTSRIMAIANNYEFRDTMEHPSSEMYSVVFHESLHATGMHANGGFMTGIESAGIHYLLEEAFVEHSTQVARDQLQPDMDVIHPDRRRKIGMDTIYYQEREILAHLTSGNAATIPADLLAATFFSPHGSRERQEVEWRLNTFLNTVFPTSNGQGLHAFSEQYEASKRNDGHLGVLMELLEINDETSPHLPEEGSGAPIKAPSYVNLDELIDAAAY